MNELRVMKFLGDKVNLNKAGTYIFAIIMLFFVAAPLEASCNETNFNKEIEVVDEESTVDPIATLKATLGQHTTTNENPGNYKLIVLDKSLVNSIVGSIENSFEDVEVAGILTSDEVYYMVEDVDYSKVSKSIEGYILHTDMTKDDEDFTLSAPYSDGNANNDYEIDLIEKSKFIILKRKGETIFTSDNIELIEVVADEIGDQKVDFEIVFENSEIIIFRDWNNPTGSYFALVNTSSNDLDEDEFYTSKYTFRTVSQRKSPKSARKMVDSNVPNHVITALWNQHEIDKVAFGKKSLVAVEEDDFETARTGNNLTFKDVTSRDRVGHISVDSKITIPARKLYEQTGGDNDLEIRHADSGFDNENILSSCGDTAVDVIKDVSVDHGPELNLTVEMMKNVDLNIPKVERTLKRTFYKF